MNEGVEGGRCGGHSPPAEGVAAYGRGILCRDVRSARLYMKYSHAHSRVGGGCPHKYNINDCDNVLGVQGRQREEAREGMMAQMEKQGIWRGSNSRLQSIHIKKEPSPVKEKTLSGYFIPGCRRSARLPQSSLRYMASPKLKKR